MLFNSSIFLFGYLPLVIAGYFLLARAGYGFASLWLALASIFFYGWWNIAFVPLLAGSIVVNYVAGFRLARHAARGEKARATLILGIVFNLVLLGYFKYANFFASTAAALTGLDLTMATIVLPIGISFFTFTQVAFLVDASRGEAREYNFVHYVLFVSYFPHLVAGPIMHHREMMPQFAQPSSYQPRWENFAAGFTILSFGLFKKVGLADNLAPLADAAFTAAASGKALHFLEAWAGALAYTFQLYFDFSGYSDMAIGISLIFGIRLPVNFDSPYKARNIAEFWRRWHITLSRFLRDYLYIPLGGNRLGKSRQYLNLLVTMLLGGLWHGAGWTFIAWGALHGAGLAVHRAFSATRAAVWLSGSGMAGKWLSILLTFIFVVVAWVFFRAESLNAAFTMLRSMAGLETVPRSIAVGAKQVLLLVAVMAAVWSLPNTQQIMARCNPALPVYRPIEPPQWGRLAWTPSPLWLAAALVGGWIGLHGIFTGRESPYLYFNF
jgi:alginate O-acetyltransferase complex protein AlgI